jgi:hypothetical protein
MTDIAPIAPIQVVSSYVENYNNGKYDITSSVKHINDNGATRIQSVDIIRYDGHGNLIRQTPPPKVDISA